MSYLLHVTKHIFAAVKNPFAFFWVQVEDKICGVVCVAFLIPGGQQVKIKYKNQITSESIAKITADIHRMREELWSRDLKKNDEEWTERPT